MNRSSVSQLAVALEEQVVPNVIHVPRADGAELVKGVRFGALRTPHFVSGKGF